MKILAKKGAVTIRLDEYDTVAVSIVTPGPEPDAELKGIYFDELDHLADDLKAAVAEARFEWEG